AVVIGLVLCIVPGIYLAVSFAVAIPALLFEGKRGSAALARSRQLLRGRWWSAAGVLVVTMLLTGIVQGGLSGLLLAVLVTGHNEVVRTVARAAANVVGQSLTTPVIAAVTTVLYYDALVRKEGFDLA